MRLVARWEKERLWPKVVVLPHLLHLAIRGVSFPYSDSNASLGADNQFLKARHFTIQNIHLQDKMLK